MDLHHRPHPPTPLSLKGEEGSEPPSASSLLPPRPEGEGGLGGEVCVDLRRIFQLLEQMETAQADKVVALARRLKPGLTAEDVRNPHDFPDLDDPDWHFEDGQLAGIQSVRFAIRGLSRELAVDGEAGQGDEDGGGSGAPQGVAG
jgi:hypothetical protein